jgi:hypothetical protein
MKNREGTVQKKEPNIEMSGPVHIRTGYLQTCYSASSLSGESTIISPA